MNQNQCKNEAVYSFNLFSNVVALNWFSAEKINTQIVLRNQFLIDPWEFSWKKNETKQGWIIGTGFSGIFVRSQLFLDQTMSLSKLH